MPNAGQIIRASDVARVVAIAVITANAPADPGSTAEVVIATIGSASYQTGRAYRVTVKGLVNSAAANGRPRLIVRKGTTTAGTSVLDTMSIPTPVLNVNYPVDFENLFTPDSNFTDSFCLTHQATTTSNFRASAAENTGYVVIEDLGADSLNSYPGINGIS
jgi:hypothetical protein